MTSKIFSVWEGVYTSFSEAGGDFSAFDSDIWIDKQKRRISEALYQYSSGTFASRDYPLSLVIALALTQKNTIRVLDFGGGMGVQYLQMISNVPSSIDKVDYYVIDGKASIDNCPEEMKKFNRLHFFYDIEQISNDFDIIHIGSTLQYVETWKILLENLLKKFSPLYFVFSDLLAGNVPTFVSHQIFYEKKIPHLFINIDEFNRFMTIELGRSLLFKQKFVRSILSQEVIFPNFALPEAYRIDRSYNLVFK